MRKKEPRTFFIEKHPKIAKLKKVGKEEISNMKRNSLVKRKYGSHRLLKFLFNSAVFFQVLNGKVANIYV